jgi:chromosome partitioning protein
VNSKGGVGKSTIAVHYAVAEREKGRRVALIDSDVQESSTRWLKELADGIRVYRLPTPDDVLEEAPKLKEQYDLVIADGPGGLSEVTRAILLRADVALLPCGPFTLDLRPAKDSMRVLKPARSVRNVIPRAFFVPNKLQANTRLSRELLSTADTLGLPVLPGLHLRQAYANGTDMRRLKRSSMKGSVNIRHPYGGQKYVNSGIAISDCQHSFDLPNARSPSRSPLRAEIAPTLHLAY